MHASKPNVIVLGGGVAGLSAAQALAAYGASVHVVEKRDRLGGHAFGWACMATDTCQYCGACLSAELADGVQDATHATVHLNSTLDRLEKKEAGFAAVLRGESVETIQADAILVATGMKPFNPTDIGDLGYAEFDQVMTTADVNKILKQDRLKEILPETACPAIAFIQCVGSRDRQSGRDYCSQVCCKTAVRQVNKILDQIPQADITLFHIDLQVIGKAFRSQASAMQGRVNLHQGVPAKIWNDRQPGKVSLIQENEATGAREAHHFDLIVLAVGMLPSAQMQKIADQLALKTDDWGFLSGDGQLAPGIYAAGTAQGPTDIITAKEQGTLTAHRMAMDLGWLENATERPGIVILGGGREAMTAADLLVQSGYAVTLLDNQSSRGNPAEGIDYFPATELISISGTAGQFRISFKSEGESHKMDAAAIVAASGAQSQKAAKASANVLSLTQFADAWESGTVSAATSVAFWLDRHGPEWKAHSRHCLDLAGDWADQDKRAIIIMEKMLVHGLKGQRLYDRARHKGVRFMRVMGADQVRVQPGQSGVSLAVQEATLTDVSLNLTVDLLVLPERVGPSPWTAQIAQTLRQLCDSEGFLQSANVRHRPMGSPRKGIFFMGACHDETDENDLIREIAGIRACLDRLTRNMETLEPPAAIDSGKCSRCLTCYRACPHAAVVIRAEYQPQIIADACVGCGICVSSCPAKAIFTDPSAEISLTNPTVGDTIVFACQRSGALAAKAAGLEDATIRIVPVRCAGQIDEKTMLQPLVEGAAKVVIAACHDGNCRSMAGSHTAGARTAKMVAMIGLDRATIRYQTIAANEPARMARIIGADG
jgi:heterodisulfide reductase subunit A